MKMVMKRAICAAALGLCVAATLPPTLLAQSRAQTLADVRQDMSVLFVELQRLKRELSTTGTSAPNVSGVSAADRMASIEGEMRRMTDKIEQLEFRIDGIVKDGTNRLGDLEFRLVELEGGDVSKLGETSTLGGATAGQGGTNAAASSPGASPSASSDVSSSVTNAANAAGSGGTDAGTGAQLAMGEQADFDTAQADLDAGNYAAAAEGFALFTTNYPGSPLETQARLGQGEALEQSGDNREAARAYLEAYTAAPDGTQAPAALFRLGRSLGRLGKVSEACVTLGEVAVRYPGTAPVAQAQAEMSALSCQ